MAHSRMAHGRTACGACVMRWGRARELGCCLIGLFIHGNRLAGWRARVFSAEEGFYWKPQAGNTSWQRFNRSVDGEGLVSSAEDLS